MIEPTIVMRLSALIAAILAFLPSGMAHAQSSIHDSRLWCYHRPRMDLDAQIRGCTYLLNQPGYHGNARSDILARRGLLRAATGDKEGADADFEEAIRLDPNNAEAHLRRRTARAHMEDLPGAAKDLAAAMRLQPTDAAGFNNRGIARQTHGDLTGAVEDYQEALRLDPYFGAAYYNRGRASLARGDRAAALADFEAAVRHMSDHPFPYVGRGRLRRMNGDLAGALSDFDRALKLDPRNENGRIARGGTRYDLGDVKGALADFETLIRERPDRLAGYFGRANALRALGDLDGAWGDYEGLVRHDEKNARALAERCVIRFRKGLHDQALQDCDTAVRLVGSGHSNAHELRAGLRLLLNEPRSALADLDVALRTDPTCAVSLWLRSRGRERLGDTAGAAEDAAAARRYIPRVEAVVTEIFGPGLAN